MQIDKNNTDYDGEIEKKIEEIKTGLIPLRVTLPMIPEELREPCTDLYNFFTAVSIDVYKNSEEYESGFYFPWYFVWLYKKFQLSGDAFIINKKEYKKFVKKHSSPKMEILFSHYGMEYNTDGEYMRVSNHQYPGMMRAVYELLEAAYKNYKVNCTDYLFLCDFRALVNHKRTYADMFAYLHEYGKQIAGQIDAFAAAIGVKPAKCTYFKRVEFKKKGSIVFILDAMNDRTLKINIGFAEINSEAFKMIEKEIEKYDDKDEFTDFWRKNLKKCTNCTPNCRKKSNIIEVFGKKTQICEAYIRMFAPKEQDLEYICRLIELRTMIVNAGISEPFYPGN